MTNMEWGTYKACVCFDKLIFKLSFLKGSRLNQNHVWLGNRLLIPGCLPIYRVERILSIIISTDFHLYIVLYLFVNQAETTYQVKVLYRLPSTTPQHTSPFYCSRHQISICFFKKQCMKLKLATDELLTDLQTRLRQIRFCRSHLYCYISVTAN